MSAPRDTLTNHLLLMKVENNPTNAKFWAQLEADIAQDQSELQRMESIFAYDPDAVVPEMEGFFSRLWGSIFNSFRNLINYYTTLFMAYKSIFTQDWLKLCYDYCDIISNNEPSDEQWTGTVALRADKATIEKGKNALGVVVTCLKNMEKIILSPSRDPIPADLANAIRALELNHCTVDTKRPSSSKAATRFTYGELGRLGTMGYGTSFNIWMANMRRVLADLSMFFKSFTDPSYIVAAVEKMEREVANAQARMERASDNERMRLSEWINNMRLRMQAFRAITRAGFDLWDMILTTGVLLPVSNLGRNVGKMDDLTSWILATNKD